MPDNNMVTSGHKGVSKQVIEEAAHEVGITLSDYNPNLRARDAGKIGGKIGGRITRELIEAGKKALDK